ncbi:MAG: radical SAM protein [Planctomycetota bacterium]
MVNYIYQTEETLKRQSERPEPVSGNWPPVTVVVPPTPQIPTKGREFLLRTPVEGVGYITTTIKNAGYPVEIIEVRGTTRTAPEVAQQIIKKGGIVALATYVDSFPFLKELTDCLKQQNPALPVILGGPLVSSLPNVLMENIKADYAVLGEGELTILELLEAIAQNKLNEINKINGLAYRDGADQIRLTAPRREIRNLDILPMIDYSLWPSVQENSEISEIGFTSSRGCYQNCHFCYKLFVMVRHKSPEKFRIEVLAMVKKYLIKYAYFNDLTFTAHRERTLKICAVLKESGITWSCSTRVENIDLELLKTMRESGCTDIWYGIESVDQDVLDANNKCTSVEEIEQAVKLTNEAGIKVMGNFIVGLLGETRESLAKMIKFIERRDVIPCSIKYLTPFPGTYIYDSALTKGLIKNEVEYLGQLSRRRVNDENDEIINCTDLPEEVLRDAFRSIRKITLARSAEIPQIREPVSRQTGRL